MKTKFFFIAAFGCLLVACTSNEPIPNMTPTHYMYMNIVKFSSPEYLNYVAVEKEYMGDEEHICHIRFLEGRACEELYIGSSPYIALPDEYYIIDWKWGDFIYPPTNFLIDVKWSEVESRNQRWEYPSIYITSNFIKEWGYVSYKTIDTYLNIQSVQDYDYIMPEWMDGYGYRSLKDIPESEVESYMADVRYQDSLRDVFVEHLSQIIKEGALNKVITPDR